MSLLHQQPDSYEGGFNVQSPDGMEGDLIVSSKLEDVHLTILSTSGFVSTTTVLTLDDDQIGDLQIALGLAKRARAEATRRRRLLGMAA